MWKQDLGLIGAAKNASKPRARGLMPGCFQLLSSEGKAEAALIGLGRASRWVLLPKWQL